MNKNILHTKVQQFISEHLNSDITKLILKGSPFKNISIQELSNQIISKKKAQQKLPTWFHTKNIYYPPKINIEQTSSEITAQYKATLVSGNSLIDITGGFGVDAFYFAKTFKTVLHTEINDSLASMVSYNYKQLNTNNIETFAIDGLEFLTSYNKNIDCIYIDPSRRNNIKGKVFLLKDCLPNVPENLDFLFSKSNQILIKNSPMLDISSGINELKFVKEVHVVAVKNEVKELLFLLEKKYTKAIEIKTINIQKSKNQLFNFQLNNPDFQNSKYANPLKYLYEPNSAILKSGGFQQIGTQLEVYKLQQHSHLYTSENLIDFPGRIFKIDAVLSYDKKVLKKFTKANITTRNFPKTVAEIRKQTKIKDGGNIYLFFTKNKDNKHIVIQCSPN